MLNNLFTSIITNGSFTGSEFAAATIASIVCGVIIAVTYMVKNKCSKSFVITLILLIKNTKIIGGACITK